MFSIILAEGYREFIYYRRYIFERLSSIIMLSFIFLGFVYSSASIVDGRFFVDKIATSNKLIGFLVWFFALDAVGHLSSALREDLHIGILEQIALTNYSLIYNMLGRIIARFFITFFNAMLIFIFFNLFFDLRLSLPIMIIPVFIITYMGLYGLGLFFAGLTLIFKRLGPVTTITRFMLLIFTGAIIPNDFLPEFLRILSKFLPMTTGLAIIKDIIFNNGLSLNLSLIILLIANTSFYLFLGATIFLRFEKKARKLGTLGTY